MRRVVDLLAIDDDEEALEAIQDLLEGVGVQVRTAKDGRVGLAEVRRRVPDLVLLDIRMPVMDGWEFLDRLRRLPGAEVPVVVMSADLQAGATARERGTAGFLQKPFELEALMGEVHAHARGGPGRDEREISDDGARAATQGLGGYCSAILDHAGEELYVVGPDGRLVWANEAAARSLGYAGHELSKRDISDIDTRFGAGRFEKYFLEIKEHPLPPYETEHIARGGHRIAKELRAVYLSVENREFVCFSGHDITERKRAERQLREREERHRLLLEGSERIFFYLHGADHRFRYLSPSVVNVLGYRREELLGHRYEEVLADDPSNAVVQDLTDRAILTGERSPSYEAVLRHKDGRQIVVEIVETPLFREEGIVLHGVVRDITERKKAERAAQAMRERLERIVETTPDGLAIVDHRGLLTLANGAAERILGRPRDALIGRRLEELSWEEANEDGRPTEPRRNPVVHAWRERASITGSVVATSRPDGSRLVLSLNATPLDDPAASMLLAFQDITVRAELARLKTEFLNVASHELRTPLTPLVLLIQQSLQRVRRGAAVESSTLERMDRQCRRMAELIGDLLDTSRLERGLLVLRPRPADLRTLVLETVEDFRRQHRHREIEVDVPASEVIATVDPARIVQVLANLLENALRYSPEEAPVSVTLSASHAKAELAVRDRGPGIPPEDQEWIFTSYARTHGRPLRHPHGLGLGLYISRSIVDLHRGTIGFDTSPSGTTFKVTLPRA